MRPNSSVLQNCCKIMYRSIRNSHSPPPPPHPPWPSPLGRGEFDGPQRTWGGAFDHNTRGVGNLICCLDFMFRAVLRIKTARICLQTLKQLPYPSVIIGEPILNVADIPRGEGGGGGVTHNNFGWGCAAQSWKPLPYFRPKCTIFHTLFQTWLSKCIPYFRPCEVW